MKRLIKYLMNKLMSGQDPKLKDFVILPRKIKDDYLEGKLTRNELDILLWIWLNTNPYNGYFTADYKGLEREFHGRISYDSIRKITSSLRKAQYIHFSNHKGRAGSFPVYPVGFLLTSHKIQTIQYLKERHSITSASQPHTELEDQSENNRGGLYHNLNEQKGGLIQKFSMDSRSAKITTTDTDNDNKNKKPRIDIASNSDTIENELRTTRSSKKIPVENFLPKSYEEERCWRIAQELGETDMRFILSCLSKYGIRPIEEARGIVKGARPGKIKNPRKYFNKVIHSLPQENDVDNNNLK